MPPTGRSSTTPFRIATDREGRLLAREVEMLVDSGAYADYGPTVASITAHQGGSLYNFQAYRHTARAVYTNNPLGGSMRGVGNGGLYLRNRGCDG